jgi:hypothetical protein
MIEPANPPLLICLPGMSGRGEKGEKEKGAHGGMVAGFEGL